MSFLKSLNFLRMTDFVANIQAGSIEFKENFAINELWLKGNLYSTLSGTDKMIFERTVL